MIAIGAGRVGTSLAARCAALGRPLTLLDRTSGWEELDRSPGSPLLVLVNTRDLDGLVARVPPPRRADLVLAQNGMLRGFLGDLGLARCTRAILYLAAASRGGAIVAGDRTVFAGPHAEAVEAWFTDLGLPARTVDWLRLTYYELEKSVWLSAFGLIGTVHGIPVGRVAPDHSEMLRELVMELLHVGRASAGIDVPLAFALERMIRYSAAIPDWPAAVRDLPFRNGWFTAEARRMGVATPLHDRLLRLAGHAGDDDQRLTSR